MSKRTWFGTALRATASVLAIAAVPAVIVTVAPSGEAGADVCASVGRRVSVSGCANLSDVMAPYVVGPDAYAPMPGAVTGCVGWNGRWVDANTCG